MMSSELYQQTFRITVGDVLKNDQRLLEEVVSDAPLYKAVKSQVYGLIKKGSFDEAKKELKENVQQLEVFFMVGEKVFERLLEKGLSMEEISEGALQLEMDSMESNSVAFLYDEDVYPVHWTEVYPLTMQLNKKMFELIKTRHFNQGETV